MTKKLLSFWLILSAIFGSASYAFASETSSETTDSMSATAVERNFEETAELNEISGSPEVVYNVSVEWGDLKFKYSFYGDYWNSKTHKYEGGTVGWKGTTDSSGTIKITNNSNAEVKAEVTYNCVIDDYYSYIVTGKFKVEGNGIKKTGSENGVTLSGANEDTVKATFSLVNAEDQTDSTATCTFVPAFKDPENLPKEEYNYPSGENSKIGTMTVKISK